MLTLIHEATLETLAGHVQHIEFLLDVKLTVQLVFVLKRRAENVNVRIVLVRLRIQVLVMACQTNWLPMLGGLNTLSTVCLAL